MAKNYATETSEALVAALGYLSAGFSILPIMPDGSKAPAVVSWKAYQSERPTDQVVRSWLSGAPRGVGLIHGAVSGNSEALDFDAPGLYEEFAALCADHGIADTVERCVLVETPSGGRHLLYRCDGPVGGSQKLAQEEGLGGKIETLIETRGEGGYTIAPGSPPECHPASAPYVFLRGCASTLPTISMDERSVLHALAATFSRYVRPGAVKGGPGPGTWAEPGASARSGSASGEGLRPGDEYNRCADYEHVLESCGWRRLRSVGTKSLWQRPGKSGVGISATSNYAERGLFHVFSSNAVPFDSTVSYSPFAVFALLRHGGDFAAAASDLRGRGYGDSGGAPDGGELSGPASTAWESASLPRASGLSAAQWPQCPEESFYGLAGQFVSAVAPHTEADPVALLIQFLSCFGSVIGGSAHFRAEADRHRGNLFAVLVGVSSKGRKGTSWGYVREVFRLVDTGWHDGCVKSGLSSGEGLIYHVRDRVEKEKTDRDGGVTTIVEDEGVTDKRLLVQESEFASILKQVQRDGNTLSATVRNAWDGQILQSLAKNSPMKATGAHVAIIGHITKGELTRDLSETETANGFGNRFLWACVRRSKELPDGGNFDVRNCSALIARLRAVVDHAKAEEGELRRDEYARALWHGVYSKLSAGHPSLFGALTGRSEAQVMRLALLYALLDCAEAIGREHLAAALALWRYCEDSVRYIFGDRLGDKVADEILRVLRTAPDGLTRDELRQHFSRNKRSDDIGGALAVLQDARLARCSMSASSGGRPAQKWHAI